MSNAGVKLLAAVIGFWLIMRTVSHDASGRTLVDHILGQAGGANQTVPGATLTSSTTVPSAGAVSGSVSSLTPTLTALAAQKGWNATQVQAWKQVINRESGGSLTAQNPTSSAYGIAQFINGPSEYAQYGGNSTTVAGQLTAMANYIKQRYGTPAAAWAHELSAGWY